MGLWAMLKGEEPSFFQQKSLPRDTGQRGEIPLPKTQKAHV